MSLYAVQDNVGNYWDFDNRGFHSHHNNARRNTTFNLALADAIVQMNGGNVVELVEAPAKIVVSKDMASWLSDAKEMRMPIEFLARCKVPDSDQEDMLRAYVNGWEVEKPKRWNVKVPHTKDVWYFKASDGNLLTICPENKKFRGEFTEAEIEHYGLQDCAKEEVTDDGIR